MDFSFRRAVCEPAATDASHSIRLSAVADSRPKKYAMEPPGQMTLYAQAPYDQPAAVSKLAGGSWCNPPGSGVGLRPSTITGNALADALLWVKTVGESDGPCDSAGGARAWDYSIYAQPGWPTTPAAQATFDPLWGLNDPAAGVWFPQQALQLAQLAVPPPTMIERACLWSAEASAIARIRGLTRASHRFI
jgi:hypothetical protein